MPFDGSSFNRRPEPPQQQRHDIRELLPEIAVLIATAGLPAQLILWALSLPMELAAMLPVTAWVLLIVAE